MSLMLGGKIWTEQDVLRYSRDNTDSPFFITDEDRKHFDLANKTFFWHCQKTKFALGSTAMTWAAMVYRGAKV